MQSYTVELDSVSYHVIREGPKDGPAVLLIHAITANLHMWDSTVLKLHKAGYSTVRYDLLGHGATPPPPPPPLARGSLAPPSLRYHIDDFTQHANQIFHKVYPDRNPFAIVGCSIGGVVAVRHAIMFPGYACKIISCAAPGMTSLATSAPKWRQRIDQLRSDGNNVSNLAEATVERWFPDPCEPDVRTRALEMTQACTPQGYVIFAEATMNFDFTGELDRVNGNTGDQKVDVMVLVGENDHNIGPKEVMVDVARKIEGAQYVAMQDTGHIPPMHQPEDFEKIVLEFLGSSKDR